jgi:hypothetical protein
MACLVKWQLRHDTLQLWYARLAERKGVEIPHGLRKLPKMGNPLSTIVCYDGSESLSNRHNHIMSRKNKRDS